MTKPFVPDAADDDQRDAEQEVGEQHGPRIIDAFDEHGLELAVVRLDTLKQVACAVRVLDGSGIHEHAEQQSLGVHGDMALTPIHRLGRILAARLSVQAKADKTQSQTVETGNRHDRQFASVQKMP